MSGIPVHTASDSADRRYVDWYLWARNEQRDLIEAHGAAAAAVKAERSGADPVPAAVAGARTAGRGGIQPGVRTRELCNWYDWALNDRKLAPDQALSLAQRVAKAYQRGFNHAQSSDMALAISRGENARGPSLGFRVTRDPGFVVFLVAIAVLLLAIFSGLGAFFLLIALFSFAVPLRSARFARRLTPMMALALVVDMATIAVVAFGVRA